MKQRLGRIKFLTQGPRAVNTDILFVEDLAFVHNIVTVVSMDNPYFKAEKPFTVDINPFRKAINTLHFPATFIVNDHKLIIKDQVGSIELPVNYDITNPPIKAVRNPDITIQLSHYDLSSIKKALSFTADDDLRPAMNGVYVGSMGIIGSDAHMLYWAKNFSPSWELILGRDIIKCISGENDLSMLMQKEGGVITERGIEVIKTVSIARPDFSVTSTVTESKYPNVDLAFPKEADINHRVTVPIIETKQAIWSIMEFNNKDFGLIKLSFKNQKMIITGENYLSYKRSIEVPVVYEGKIPGFYGVKDTFLLKLLGVDGGDTLVMSLQDPIKSILIGDHLLMPIMIT